MTKFFGLERPESAMRVGWMHAKGSCEFDEVASLTEFAEHGAYGCQMCWTDKEMESSMMENERDDGERVG